MDTKTKSANLTRRRHRVRAKVSGTDNRPRLCVTRTNANVYAQLIDDVSGKTLVSASTVETELSGARGSNVDAARKVGELLGRRAGEAGLKQVVFDRSGRLYHGRVKAVADGAREAGLEF
jgi:large subunit ribosomal protein L18